MVDSSSPKYGEKASYYSAVCLETGEVEWMEVAGNSNAGTSVAFLERLRGRRGGGLTVIWDNAPAHGGEALREYLKTPDLNLRLVNPVSSTGQALPGYSPDCNAPIFNQSRHLGLGERRGHRQSVPGDPGGSTGTGRELPGWSGQPEGRGETALPDGAAIKGRDAFARLPARSTPSGKCTSHLGFGLG